MKILGKSLGEYIRFEWAFLTLILLVGLGRLGLSLAGVPNSKAKFLSLTVLFLVGMLYYGVRVYTSGFGSYKQLLPVVALQVILGNCIIIGSIILSMQTGNDNIYSAPEFSPGRASGRTWAHVRGHAVAMIILSIILWGLGCLVMLITRKLSRPRPQTA